MAQTREVWVKPRTTLNPVRITLPACEQIGVNVILRALECFLTDSHFEESSFVASVQLAVAALIEEIPLLAGRIHLENGTRIGIIGDDPKVRLRFVRHVGTNAKDLDAKHWPPHALKPAKYCSSMWPGPGVGSPIFSLQLNILDGGVVFACEFNHVTTDGLSRMQTVAALGHFLRLALDGQPLRSSPFSSSPARLDKMVAYGTHPARPILQWPNWRKKLPTPQNAMSREEKIKLVLGRMAQMSYTIWHLPPDKIEDLRKASVEPGSSRQPSRNACIAILLWRSIARARNHPPDTVTSMITPVQARGRVPEMPLDWFGNAIVYGKADATAAELGNVSVSELSQRITASIKTWTPERLHEYWGSVEDCKDLDAIEPDKDHNMGPQIEISSVADAPSMTSMQWGRGLIPRSSRQPGLAPYDGYIIVMPRLASGGIEVHCYLTRDTLKALASDPEFRGYTEYRASNDIAIDRLIAENSPKNVDALLAENRAFSVLDIELAMQKAQSTTKARL